MTESDTSFSDGLIKETYLKILDSVPKSNVIKYGDILKVNSQEGFNIEFEVPPRNVSFYMECYPRNLNL